jgi:ribosome-binding protein aMBF1 (putative translation factor)
MHEHQDWNVVVLRKHTKANPTDARAVNAARRDGALVETKLKQKTTTTLVSVKKLEDNQEDFHHKVISKEVATEIMKKRLEKKLTQSDLGKQINEHTAVIQEIESGKAIHNSQVLNKIYRVLGIQRKK